MAKRFVKYETENPVGVDSEGVLTGNGGGSSEIRLYVKLSESHGREVFWDVECTQKLTAEDIISLVEKVRDILLIDVSDGVYVTYRTCVFIGYDDRSAAIYNGDTSYTVYR